MFKFLHTTYLQLLLPAIDIESCIHASEYDFFFLIIEFYKTQIGCTKNAFFQHVESLTRLVMYDEYDLEIEILHIMLYWGLWSFLASQVTLKMKSFSKSMFADLADVTLVCEETYWLDQESLKV